MMNFMKRKILLFLISASVIMSCDEAKDPTLQIGNQMAKILTQDEAMANLYHFMNDVGYSCTRSDFEKSIQSIDTYPIITKSESSVEAYIVNFEDNSGYAVLGARTDMIPSRMIIFIVQTMMIIMLEAKFLISSLL